MKRGKNRAPLEQERLLGDEDHGDAERVPRNGALVASNPDRMLELAITSGLGADGIEKLVRLKLEMQVVDDRKALFAAVAKAKRDFPVFEKSRSYDVVNSAGKKVRTGDFAPLDEMLPGATPVLESNDLFVTWGQQVASPGVLRVTCTVTHANGQAHSEGFDVTTESNAGMSPQQKYSSATSFGMRCSFMLLFGIVPAVHGSVEKEFDNTPISDEQAHTLRAMREETKTKGPALLEHFGIAKLEDLPARRYREAVQIMEDVRKGTYKQ